MNNRQRRSNSLKNNLKTFTYFIPSPPSRKTGYREKEFDKIVDGILQSGFEIIEMQTQSVATGLFVIFILKAKSKKIRDLDLDLDIQERFKLRDTYSSSDIILEDDTDA